MALASTVTNAVVFSKADFIQALKDYMIKNNINGNIDSDFTITLDGDASISDLSETADIDTVLTITLPM